MVYWHKILCVVLGGSREVGVTVSHQTRGELCPGSGVLAFLAPGTGFVEDNLFTAGVGAGVWGPLPYMTCGCELFSLCRWNQDEVIVELGGHRLMGCILSEEGGLETDTEAGRHPVETQSLREEAETQARTSCQGGWKKEQALPTLGLQGSAF